MKSECENSSLASSHKMTSYKKRIVNFVFIFTMLSFLLATLFDPADKVLGLKLPLYLACWGMGLVACLMSRQQIKISSKLLMYAFLIILIPILSISYYFISDGSEPFEGFLLLKAYLFISFAVLVYITKFDTLKYLSVALTVLAISILALTAIVLAYPDMYTPLYKLGEEFGIFSIDGGRDYGAGIKWFQMYFVTSPMLVIPIAYYFDLMKTLKSGRLFYGTLTLINICAMFIAGTRNNLIMAIFLPLALVILYSRRRLYVAMVIAIVAGLFVFAWHEEIGAFFDPTEASNSTKLAMLGDYAAIFSDPSNLIFGRGLGSYEYWTGRGYKFVTELTYLEIIRNFGLLFGGLMILLLVYPVLYAFVLQRSYKEKNIILAYAAYLVMSMTNPLLFSSMGMLILGAIIANISIYDVDIGRRRSTRASTQHPRSEGESTASGTQTAS